MEARKVAAVISILIGLSMLGMWGMLLWTGQVPELKTAPVYIAYHLTAEFLTAAVLLAGGWGLLTRKKWGFKIHLVSLGMLLYAVLGAGGFYAQQGQEPMTIMFGGLALVAAVLIGSGFAGKLS